MQIILFASVFLHSTPIVHAALSPLHVVGTHLLDASGNTVILHGVNFDVCEQYGHISQQQFNIIKSWGCNVVRLNVECYELEAHHNSDGSINSASMLTWIDNCVSYATSAGLYVILNGFHTSTGPSGSNPSIPNNHLDYYMTHDWTWSQWLNLWNQYAARYVGYSNIMYELINEPLYVSASDYQSHMRQAIDQIRYQNPNSICVVQTSSSVDWEGWSFNFEKTNPISRSNVIYSYHLYGGNCQDNTQSHIMYHFGSNGAYSAYADWMLQNGRCVMATEFGGGQNQQEPPWDSWQTTFINNFMLALDNNGYSGYTAHQWVDYGGEFEQLLVDWNGNPTVYGNTIRTYYQTHQPLVPSSTTPAPTPTPTITPTATYPTPTPTPTRTPTPTPPGYPTQPPTNPTPTPTPNVNYPIESPQSPNMGANFLVTQEPFIVNYSSGQSFGIQSLSPVSTLTFSVTDGLLNGTGSVNASSSGGAFNIDTTTSGTLLVSASGEPVSIYIDGVYANNIPFNFVPGDPLITWTYGTTPIIISGNGLQYYFRSDTYITLGVSGYGFDSDFTNTLESITHAYSGSDTVTYGFQVYLFRDGTHYTQLTTDISATIPITGNFSGQETSTINMPYTSVTLGFQALFINVTQRYGTGDWVSIAQFVSPVLITNSIEASTWTFTLYIDQTSEAGTVTSTFNFGNSDYRSGINNIVFSTPLRSDVAMWYIRRGDWIGFLVYEYWSILGTAFYAIILFAVSGTLYFRFKNSGVVLFFFVMLFSGGFLFALLPVWAAIVAAAIILLIGTFVFWRLLR